MRKIYYGLFLLFLFAACKKDFSYQPDSSSIHIPTDVNEAAFFRMSGSEPSIVRKLAKRIQDQNNKYHFVEQLIKREGYAIWDKVSIYSERIVGANLRGTNAAPSTPDTALMVPLVLPNTAYVNSFLACRINGDTVHIKLHRGRAYKSYGNDSHPDSLSAKKLALEVMFLNRDVFGIDDFQIKDSTLFERTFSKATNRVRIKEEAPAASRIIFFSTIRCYETGNDGDAGQVVGTEPGHANNYSTAGWDCYQQWVMVFLPDYGGGGDGFGGFDPNAPPPGGGGGGVAGNYGQDPALYWWDGTPCPDPNAPQEVVIDETGGPCSGVIGWRPLRTIMKTTVLLNDFTTPCIVAAKSKLPDFDLNIMVQNIFRHSGSQPPQEWKIVYQENPNLNDGHPTNPTPIVAGSIYNNATKEWRIILNSTFWQPNRTTWGKQELAGLNIIHEYVHGLLFVYKDFFNLTTLNNVTTHTVMFKNCIDYMKAQMMKSYGISAEDATALALQGLDDVLEKEYNQQGTLVQYRQDYNQFAIDNYGMSIPAAEVIYDQYIFGTKGTKCQ